jgi:hypothetical protein
VGKKYFAEATVNVIDVTTPVLEIKELKIYQLPVVA